MPKRVKFEEISHKKRQCALLKTEEIRESVPKRLKYYEISHKKVDSTYQKRRETEKSVPKKVNFQQISHICGACKNAIFIQLIGRKHEIRLDRRISIGEKGCS